MIDETFDKLTSDFKNIAFHSKTWQEIEAKLLERIKNTNRNEALIDALIDLIGCFKQAEDSYRITIKKLQDENKNISDKLHQYNNNSDRYCYELTREQIRNEALRQFIINLNKKRNKTNGTN